MKILPLVLAGGFGTRLYPLSTFEQPKQFIPLLKNGDSFFQNTARRLRRIFQTETILTACNKQHLHIVEKQLQKIGDYNYNIIVEPDCCNTFATILATLKYTQQKDIDIIFASPSDSFIENNDAFCFDVQKSCMFSYLRNEHVLFGIHPTEPNTNYGYIKINYSNKFRMAGGCDTNFSSVKNFLEKPDIKTATRLLKTKNCYWNSGCFVLNKKVLIEDVQQYQQSAFAIASKMELKTMYDKKYLLLPSASDFAKLPNIAFDKAIIEKSQHLACCVANFDWCDIGSWKSIMLLIKQMNIRFD